MPKKEWIRISTAASLRGVTRQAVRYQILAGHLKTKDIDDTTFVDQAQWMSLKLRQEKKETTNEEDNRNSSREQVHGVS